MHRQKSVTSRHVPCSNSPAKRVRAFGVVVDTVGNVYVVDSRNNTIRKVSATGTVSTLAGTAGVIGAANGTGTAASYYLISSVGR